MNEKNQPDREMPGTIYMHSFRNQRKMEATEGEWENASLIEIGDGLRARMRPIFTAKRPQGALADPSTDCFADHGLSFGPKE